MKARIWLAMLAVYIAWGSTYLAIRVAIETMPPFLMAGTRFVIAGLILYAWRLAAGDARPSRLEWRSAAIVGTLLLVGGNGGVVWAEQWVSSGIAALIVGSAPLMMALIDALRPGGRKPGWWAARATRSSRMLLAPAPASPPCCWLHFSGPPAPCTTGRRSCLSRLYWAPAWRCWWAARGCSCWAR